MKEGLGIAMDLDVDCDSVVLEEGGVITKIGVVAGQVKEGMS